MARVAQCLLEAVLGFFHTLVGQQDMAFDDQHVRMVAVQLAGLVNVVDSRFGHFQFAVGKAQLLIDFH